MSDIVLRNEQLEREVEELRSRGHTVELTYAEGWANVVFRSYSVPKSAAWTSETTDILVKLPLAYPSGKPDMFWTPVCFTLASGAIPNRADAIENALSTQWRRWSWHPQSWNPACDNLSTFLAFVETRLAKAV